MSQTTIQVKPSEAREIITMALKAHLTPMLHGSPAIGKSSIVHAIAKEFNVKVIDLRLSQCDPTDLLGFPRIDEKTGKADYVPMATFPIAGDPLPQEIDADGKPTGKIYSGWLLFLDELPTAPPAVQAAAYKLILDRMVGNHKLHNKVAIVGAGNLESDNALVHPMSTALQSRMVHLNLRIDNKEWLDWARDNGIDYRITSYIEMKGDLLYNFRADHADHTYASPRTWAFADQALKVLGSVDNVTALPMLAGCVGAGVAGEFLTFCQMEKELPKLAQIIADPTGTPLSNNASVNFLLTGMIGANADIENLTALVTYVRRMPTEFQAVCLRDIVKRDNKKLTHPSIQKWVAMAGATLF